ncbi:hypothetical protein RhiJN_12777 [Ceratobasidium sp. AG-Ba]|nr:hypothetical protein RhiJN_12777 [Ceratobasidium sp. AG-Ba]
MPNSPIRRIETSAEPTPSVPYDLIAHQANHTSPESDIQGTVIQVGISRVAHTENGTSSLGKRGPDAFGQEYQCKRKRFEEGHTVPEPPLDNTAYSHAQHSPATSGEVDRVYHPTIDPSSRHAPTQRSAVQLAQQAADIASGKPKRSQRPQESWGDQTELERLRAERDAARESCRALEQEVRQLKQFIKDKRKKEDKVFRLVTASLQSLHDSSEAVELE